MRMVGIRWFLRLRMVGRLGRLSRGNVYVMDIFHTGQGGNPAADVKCGEFSLESTVYWHER